MSSLSDIDLTQLHRSRLNERVYYKLSSWSRRQVDAKRSDAIPNGRTVNKCSSTSSLSLASASNSSGLNDGWPHDEQTMCNHAHCLNAGHSMSLCHCDDNNEKMYARFVDDRANANADGDHFSILRRRRSGTWP